MASLPKVTDADLLRNGLATLEEFETHGPLMNGFRCWRVTGFTHAFGEPELVPDGDGERFCECSKCGGVSRFVAPYCKPMTLEEAMRAP